jgi:hypothetical protein
MGKCGKYLVKSVISFYDKICIHNLTNSNDIILRFGNVT